MKPKGPTLIRLLLAALVLAACGQPVEGLPADDAASVEQFLSVCAGSSTLPGIDVSSYQGTINWSQVAGSGIKFGYTKATEALSYQDAYFHANWSGMKANGIARGAYHFFHPNLSGKQQADYYLAFVGTFSAGDLPPMLDWEISSGASASTAAANAQAFIDEIRAKTGLTTVIYTSPGIWSGFGITTSFSAEPLWVAHYLFCTGAGCCPTMPSGWTKWVAWQWSDKGAVPGISGNVDLDLFNGDLTALTNFGGGPVCTDPIGHGLGSGGPATGACSGATPATSLPGGCGSIGSGLGLQKGQSVKSCDGRFELAMQSDGNLVEYTNGIALWASHTTPDGAAAVMQGDGNLVVYSSTGCPLWASKTAGHNGAHFALQDDGNLVVYDGSTALWSSGSGPIGAAPAASCGTVAKNEALAPGATVSACGGCFDLVMQGDGNLVVYKKGGTAIWQSHTASTDGYTTEVRSGGNVALVSKQGCELWSTNTGGHTGARLAMQDDGNLVVYDPGNNVLWQSASVSCAGGCNCNPPPPPMDAGTPPPPMDAGTPPVDAGTPPPPPMDAGTPPPMDAGMPPPELDAGVLPPDDDGGTAAAGDDAGTTPEGPDAGTGAPEGPGEPLGPAGVSTPAPDGVEPLGPVHGGCSSSGGGPQSLFAFGLAALLAARRRRNLKKVRCRLR